MQDDQDAFPRYSPVGESGLLLELADELSNEINQQVYALDAQLCESRLEGVLEWIPAYASLLVLYDPLSVTLPDVRQWLQDCLNSFFPELRGERMQVEIPVRYGGLDGPDLDHVAALHGLSPQEVVEKHVAKVYRVGMMGFTPGFAYLLGLDPDLATSRQTTPRTNVPAGSIGIAGSQTGIYPLDSPGGWQLIGRTDLALFTPDKAPYFLLSPGDEVRFIPIKAGAVS